MQRQTEPCILAHIGMNRALLDDGCLNADPSDFSGGHGAGPIPIDCNRIGNLDDRGLGGLRRDNWCGRADNG